MADTLRVIVDEIRTTLNQTFDDKVVSRAQVAHWVIIVGNQLLGQHNAKRDSGAFLNIYPDVPILVATDNSQQNIVKGRKYIELPAAIFDYDKDGGVESMFYYDPNEGCEPEHRNRRIQRTTQSALRWLKKSLHTKPSPKNPYFWRAGDYFYIEGIESVPVKFVEVGIYQTISPLEKIDLDAPFFFPQELLRVLKDQVTGLARYSFLFKNDRDNDGDGVNNTQQQIPKIISVNQERPNE